MFTCTSELVCLAWLKSSEGLEDIPAATNLPSEVANWTTSVFIQVSTSPLGLPPHQNFPFRGPRFLLKCWGRTPKCLSAANQVAELIRSATYAFDAARVVEIPPVISHGSVVNTYDTATVILAQTMGEPSRVTGDPANLARYDIPILLEYYPTHITISGVDVVYST
jgi:hypothetical protein